MGRPGRFDSTPATARGEFPGIPALRHPLNPTMRHPLNKSNAPSHKWRDEEARNYFAVILKSKIE
jgi:hypothetical protein